MKSEILEFVESFIRPRVQADGGEIVISSMDGDELKLTLMGECAVCSSACGVRGWIETQIHDRFGKQIHVVFGAKKRYFQDV